MRELPRSKVGIGTALAAAFTIASLLGAHTSVAQTSVAPTSVAPTSVAQTSSTAATAPLVLPPLKKLSLQPVASGLVEPVDVAAPLDDGLMYVLQRAGQARVVENGRVLKIGRAHV